LIDAQMPCVLPLVAEVDEDVIDDEDDVMASLASSTDVRGVVAVE